MMMILQYQPDV